MTVLSYSPYFKLRQVKEPINREIEIYAKMHADREMHERDARRAMEHQAELADVESELVEFQHEYVELEQLADARCAEKAMVEEQLDAAHARIAELEAALWKAEAALSDIGDADREEGDDVAWCEKRACDALPIVRCVFRNR